MFVTETGLPLDGLFAHRFPAGWDQLDARVATTRYKTVVPQLCCEPTSLDVAGRF